MSQKSIPILDYDALIAAIQALSAPSGTDVAISPTGMHIVTEDDVQGAISELDTAVDSVNASLTNYIATATNHNTNNYLTGNIKFKFGNEDVVLKIQIGKLDNSTNYVQFFVNDTDYGYVRFDTSRNIGVIS